MKSIQNRLLLMLLIFIILPYFLSVFFIYSYTKHSVEQQELKNSHEQLRENSTELQQYFEEMINLPYILYRDPKLFQILNNEVEDSSYLEKSLENFSLMRNEIRQIQFYMDKDKEALTVYNATASARKSRPNFLQQPFIKELYNPNIKYVIQPPHSIQNYNNSAIVPQSDKTKVITFHHKIVDVLSNKFLGTISMDVDYEMYARICNNLIGKDQESVLLISEDNVIVYANNTELIGQAVSPHLQQKIERNAETGDDIILANTLSGPLDQWKLVKITPSHILFDDARKTSYTFIIVGIIIGLLGVLMISLISYKITHPLKLLTQKVRTIKGGNMNIDFNDKREDEIGYLELHIKEMMERINLHINREYKLEIENKENRLRALKSQVNPHFLFNALQSIGAVALRSNAPSVYHLITSLSKMMRYSINANKWVKVQEEVEYIKAYLILQMERFRKEVHYSIHISDPILNMQIPSMILQPLVENFFKHSYEEGFYDAPLNIYGEVQKSFLHLVVESYGASITEEKLKRLQENIYHSSLNSSQGHKHIGLKNIHDRLILNYGTQAHLEIDRSNGDGFIVKIAIPLGEQPLKED
ncbi:histidine kinase [Bacillus sp. JZ8]